MLTPKLRFVLSMGIVVYLLPHHHSGAQEQSGAQQDSSNRPQLEEVIVTATKRALNLQDVAASVQAIGRELLQNNEINNVSDLAKLVPSLQYTESFDPQTSDIRIRGIGQDAGSALNVGLVVDGVPLASASQAVMEFADIERIEVLRGPQGTLFGKNASAGVIHYITRDAAPELEAYARFTAETQDTFPGGLFKTQLGVNNGLTDTLAGRLSGYYTEVDGQYEDIIQKDNIPDTESWGLRGKLRWDPTDSLVVKPILEVTRSSGELTPFVYRSRNPKARAREREAYPESEVGPENRNTKTFGDKLVLEVEAFALGVDWELGWANLSAITGVRQHLMERVNSVPGLDGARVDAILASVADTTTYSQEVRLASPASLQLPWVFGKFDYTVGMLWFRSETDGESDLAASNVPVGDAVIGDAVGIDGLPSIDLPPGDSIGVDAVSSGTSINTNIGVFGEITWHFNERLRTSAGLRWVHDEYTAHRISDSTVFHEQSGAEIISSGGRQKGELKDTAVIGNWTLQYDWADHSVTYFRVATGYRAGILQFDDADTPQVKPEHTLNVEAGIKSRLFDNRMHVNVAVFNQIIDDYQASQLRPGSSDVPIGPTAAVSLTDNAGQLLTRGVELDVMMRPLESLTLTGSLLYNKTRYNEFIGPCFQGQEVGERGGKDIDGDGECDTQNLEGLPLSNAPEWAASLSGRYTKRLDDGGSNVFVQLTGRWKDEVNYSTDHHPGAWGDAFQVWNLRFGWLGLDSQLELAAYVNNLFKEFYVTALYPFSHTFDRRDVAHFVPRSADTQYGLTVSYKY